MKDELAFRLFSRRPLTPPAVRDQIIALSNFGDGLFRPDKCGAFEPIRTPFEPTDIREPISWLSKPGGIFMYRKGRPAHFAGEIWNLSRCPDARFPAGPFINYWTGDFDGKWASRVGMEKVEDFMSEMFRATGSDLAFLTSEIDLQAKNRPERSLSYEGLDPARGVPGFYWTNFFSDEYGQWLSLSDLPKELAVVKKLASGGVLLKFCESSDDCRSLEVLQRQRTAIDWLGPQRFFDIRFPDRKLDVPNWDRLPQPAPDPANSSKNRCN
jgi:hypothetical protein